MKKNNNIFEKMKNVGDKFVFDGFKTPGIYGFENDIGREQVIINITDDRCYSVFLDTGLKNDFGTRSLYIRSCFFVGRSESNIEYENCVPVVWEDDL
jgi:hypothetical protein